VAALPALRWSEMTPPVVSVSGAAAGATGTGFAAGSVILTGTPAGVGKGMNPPQFLKAGDTVKVSIEGIGTLANYFE